jgi:hypothetical protein
VLLDLKKDTAQETISRRRDKENPLQLGDVVRCNCQSTDVWYSGLIGTIVGIQCYAPIVQFGSRSARLGKFALERI